jgi:parvulin-like peptidyl-prolyl isomerase
MPMRVNGEVLDYTAFRLEVRELRPRFLEAMGGEDPQNVERRLLESARQNVIDRMLLRQAALADPEPIAEAAVEQRLAEQLSDVSGRTARFGDAAAEARLKIELDLRVERFIAHSAGRIAAPRNKEIMEYYRKQREHFLLPEMVHASHIVKNVDESVDDDTARRAIREIQERLQAGADFAEVADRSSDCPGRGGDLGWWPRGQLVAEFEDVIFTLPEGTVSGIFRTVFGYHIATVHQRRGAHTAALEEVRDQIERFLSFEKQAKARERVLSALRRRATIDPAEPS